MFIYFTYSIYSFFKASARIKIIDKLNMYSILFLIFKAFARINRIGKINMYSIYFMFCIFNASARVNNILK